MTHVQKYQIASVFAQSSASFGFDTARILRLAALPSDFTGVGARPVTALEYLNLWEAVDTVAELPDLPYRMADAVLEGGIDSSLYSFFSSPTVRAALERKALLKPLISPINMKILTERDHLHIEFDSVLEGHQLPSLLGWFSAAYLLLCLRRATGVELTPVSVAAPAQRSDGSLDRDRFTCDIHAGAVHRMTLRAEVADLPVVSRKPPLWTDLETGLKNQFTVTKAPQSMTARVRQVLIEGLPGGQANLDQIADSLAMSKRSVQRRLREEDVSFKDILEETRRALAMSYLKNTEMSSQEIAFLLGFQDPTSFFRAFRDWTGTSPRAVRNTAV